MTIGIQFLCKIDVQMVTLTIENIQLNVCAFIMTLLND